MSDIIDNSKEEAKHKKLDKKRERELSDIRFLVRTREGRRFIWKVLERGRVFVDPFAGDSTNGTHYNLGRQSISRDFLNDILEASPEALGQMQNEQRSESQGEEIQEKIEDEKSGRLI